MGTRRRGACLALLVGLCGGRDAQAAEGRVRVSALVADSSDRPLQDAVVFLYDLPDAEFPPPRHPYVMDQVDKEFMPHVLPILAGGLVRFPNKDDLHHHIYSFSGAKTFELPLYKGEPADPVRFERPGVVRLGCNIHDWMSGIILVLPNPYFAVTGADGRTELSVPPRKGLKLAVFHERLKGSVDATRKPLKPQGAAAELSWRLELKPVRKKRRPALEYR